jgi:DNA-binding transcriptional LysR family regulator
VIDNLPALVTFARIVATGSLSGAAFELDVPLSVVSKRLAQLEARIGIRLIQRTTRRQTLTEEGALFHAQVLRILDEIEQAELMLAHQRAEVSGLLRITAPGEFGRQRMVPIIKDFQRLHPNLSIQLELTDTVIDIVESGFDIALRYGKLADSSLIARQLAPNFRIACASPDYLKEHGTPVDPVELIHHRCIVLGNQREVVWRFEDEYGESSSVRVRGALVTNDGEAAHKFAMAGAGIVIKSMLDVSKHIEEGRLHRVFPHHTSAGAPLHAIFPHSRHLVPRVRVFVDYLQEWFSKNIH